MSYNRRQWAGLYPQQYFQQDVGGGGGMLRGTQNSFHRNQASMSQSEQHLFQTSSHNISNIHNQPRLRNFDTSHQSHYLQQSQQQQQSGTLAESMMGMPRNNNVLSNSNLLHTQTQQHLTMFSPSSSNTNEYNNRMFAFYSPHERDIHSPHGLINNESLRNGFLDEGRGNNAHNYNLRNRIAWSRQDRILHPEDGMQREILQHEIDVMNHLRSHIDQSEQQQQESNEESHQPDFVIEKDSKEKESEELERKLKNYSSIVMQQTFFHHLSLQIFFILVLIMIIYSLSYSAVLFFLFFVDICSFIYSFKRSKIETIVDPTKEDNSNNIWRILETIFSVVFKICLFIHLEVAKYSFYYVPCSLLIYVLIRFFFVISKKLADNGSVSTLLNESFTWGFKIFFMGQIFLIAVKLSDKIDWSWQDVFWPYWVFFYIMIGTNSVFAILLLSKILLKCLGQPVQSFEIKGLCWFFLLSNGICVNSTLFVKGLISFKEHQSENEAQIAFKYSMCFICAFIIYTLLFWKGIWVFMFHFSQEKEDQDGDTSEIRNDYRTRSPRKSKNYSSQNPRLESGSKASNGTNQNNRDGENENEADLEDQEAQDEAEEDEDGYELDENEVYGGVEYGNGQSGQLPDSGSGRVTQQMKKKNFQKISLTPKNVEKKGLPLFLEKLSSTYYTVFTNNGIKRRKESINESFKKSKSLQNQNSQADKKKQKANGGGGIAPRGSGRLSVSPGRMKRGERGTIVNRSDLDLKKGRKNDVIDQMNGKQQQQQLLQLQQFGIDSPKGMSDSLRQVDISFNEEKMSKVGEAPKGLSELQMLAYETQLKFTQMILSPKGQELKRKEQEKRKKLEGKSESNINSIAKEKQLSRTDITKGRPESTQIGESAADDSNITCVICFENEPDTVYLPCGHGGICYDCGMDVLQKTGECYLCRNEIKQVVQIDFKSKEAKKKVIAVTAALDGQTDCNDTNPNTSIQIQNGQNREEEQGGNSSQLVGGVVVVVNSGVGAVENAGDENLGRDLNLPSLGAAGQDEQLEPAIYGGRQMLDSAEIEDIESGLHHRQFNSMSFEIQRRKMDLIGRLAEDQNPNDLLFSSGRDGSHTDNKCINSQGQLQASSDPQILIKFDSSDFSEITE